MRKIVVITIREYIAAVRSKGFIVGIILMPLLMGGGMMIQKFTQGIVDLSVRKVAVLDRTEDSVLFPILQRAAVNRNENDILDSKTGKQIAPPFVFEQVDPGGDLSQARIRLADRVRKGELFAIVEIGPNVLSPRKQALTTAPAAGSDAYSIIESTNDPESLVYYSSNRPTYHELREFVQKSIQPRIVSSRLGESQTSIEAITNLFGSLVVPRGLASRDEAGRISFEPRQNEIAMVAMPMALIMLMLVVVLVGASPLTTNIIEEKQLRIAEVLLGSVTPFELMMGKLLGGVATSLTLGSIYLLGTVFFTYQLGLLHLVSPGLVAWFVVFTVIASLMYGSMFVVAGAAATNVKEAQALMTPMMLIVVLPMFLVAAMLNEPHGLVAKAGTFFPLTAPMVTIFRLAVPPALPWWQPAIAILGSVLVTIELVWIAGRVFRAGFLLVGRPASMRELLTWMLRG